MPSLVSTYKILTEYNLVIQNHKGILSLKAYIDFAKKIVSDPLYSQNYNHIIIIKEAEIKASFEDLNIYAEFSELNFKKPKNRNIAIITKTPNQVVISTLLKLLDKRMAQNVEIFSTTKSAVKWLGIDEKLLSNLL
ncbi:MAG: hypothetical protein QM495_07385 [Lutibacter sp.]|uniref:hypothetical protein n=1 Tax=Lutibacter sp. TaxID=1925666 RepID=UPI00385A332E